VSNKILKNPDLQKKNPETQQDIENPVLGTKPQIWGHWPSYSESTKKVTQLIEQVNVI